MDSLYELCIKQVTPHPDLEDKIPEDIYEYIKKWHFEEREKAKKHLEENFIRDKDPRQLFNIDTEAILYRGKNGNTILKVIDKDKGTDMVFKSRMIDDDMVFMGSQNIDRGY